jgi:MFS family permease
MSRSGGSRTTRDGPNPSGDGTGLTSDGTGADFDPRPTHLASLLAVGLAAVAVLAVASAPGQRRPMVLAAGGALVLRLVPVVRGWPWLAVPVFLASAVILGGAGWDLARSTVPPSRLAEFLPGLVGTVVVALGVYPIRRGWTTRLATLGVGLVLTSVVMAGLIQDADRPALLGSTVAAVAAWDAARQADSLGRQTGRGADSDGIEAVHSGGTLVAGAVTAGVATAVYDAGVPTLGLSAGLGLLFALVALAVLAALTLSL